MQDRDKQIEQISRLIDGQLDDAASQELLSAIQRDAELAALYKQLQETRNLLRALPRQKAPDDFVNRVLQQAERLHLVRVDEPVKKSRLRFVHHAISAAIVIISVSICMSIGVTIYYAANIKNDNIAVANKPAPLKLRKYTAASAKRAAGVETRAVAAGESVSESFGVAYGLKESAAKGFDLADKMNQPSQPAVVQVLASPTTQPTQPISTQTQPATMQAQNSQVNQSETQEFIIHNQTKQ